MWERSPAPTRLTPPGAKPTSVPADTSRAGGGVPPPRPPPAPLSTADPPPPRPPEMRPPLLQRRARRGQVDVERRPVQEVLPPNGDGRAPVVMPADQVERQPHRGSPAEIRPSVYFDQARAEGMGRPGEIGNGHAPIHQRHHRRERGGGGGRFARPGEEIEHVPVSGGRDLEADLRTDQRDLGDAAQRAAPPEQVAQ